MEDKMEKEKIELENKETNKKENKLTSNQKEIIITIIVLLASIVVGFLIGKYLFELMY